MPKITVRGPSEGPSRADIAKTLVDGFVAGADDFTVSRTAWITSIELVCPVGETVDITKVTISGNRIPWRTGMTSGRYMQGEYCSLAVGERLEVVSAGVVSGDRELIINASLRL